MYGQIILLLNGPAQLVFIERTFDLLYVRLTTGTQLLNRRVRDVLEQQDLNFIAGI